MWEDVLVLDYQWLYYKQPYLASSHDAVYMHNFYTYCNVLILLVWWIYKFCSLSFDKEHHHIDTHLCTCPRSLLWSHLDPQSRLYENIHSSRRGPQMARMYGSGLGNSDAVGVAYLSGRQHELEGPTPGISAGKYSSWNNDKNCCETGQLKWICTHLWYTAHFWQWIWESCSRPVHLR